jgi:2,3-bisphosphoglycerate-dependent phosphoglycerate mutase
MAIRIVRHAESTANAGAATADPASIPLSPAGEAQAARLAAWLPERPSLIVTSPYARTLATARPLLARYPEVPHEQWPIHEFTYLSPGAHVGTSQRERAGAVDAFWQRSDPDLCDGPGAESLNQFAARVAAFEARLRQLEGDAVIFTHGQLMQALLYRASGGDLSTSTGMRGFRSFCLETPVINTGMLILPTDPPWRVQSPHL